MDDAYLLMAVPAAALVGAVLASTVACLPGLHLYTLLVLGGWAWRASGLEAEGAGAFVALGVVAGALAGCAVAGAIPALLLGAPDEGSIFMAPAGRRWLAVGRGREAVVHAVLGAAGGAALLLVCGGALLPRILPLAAHVLRPHRHWILWCIIVFVLMSARPRLVPGVVGAGRAFRSGGLAAVASAAAFLLSGLLGFVVQCRSGAASAHVSAAAFVGLFTVPPLILGAFGGDGPPVRAAARVSSRRCATTQSGASSMGWPWGMLAGTLSGFAAAVVTPLAAGIAGLFAEHMPCGHDDRTTFTAQGAARMVCYGVWGLSLFLPGFGAGDAVGLLEPRELLQGATPWAYPASLIAMLVAVATASLVTPRLASAMLGASARWGSRRIAASALAVAVTLVFCADGPGGLPVLAVATGIGLLPLLFESRGLYCLGVILLPQALFESGLAPDCARLLGLG